MNSAVAMSRFDVPARTLAKISRSRAVKPSKAGVGTAPIPPRRPTSAISAASGATVEPDGSPALSRRYSALACATQPSRLVSPEDDVRRVPGNELEEPEQLGKPGAYR
jgi:hypothetical protein